MRFQFVVQNCKRPASGIESKCVIGVSEMPTRSCANVVGGRASLTSPASCSWEGLQLIPSGSTSCS